MEKESKTDWKRLNSMSDEDINYDDIPELDDEFFEKAKLVIPANHKQKPQGNDE